MEYLYIFQLASLWNDLIGYSRQTWQHSSPPKIADVVRWNNPSFFILRFNLCFIFQSLSLYQTITSCPERYPSANYKITTLIELLLGLKTKLVTCIVETIFRERMSVNCKAVVMSLVISFLKGQIDMSVISLLQSTARRKWKSCWEQVVVTTQKGYPGTRSFLIQQISYNPFDYSLSIIIYYIAMSHSEHVIGMTMKMSVKWTTNISFIFESWTALEGETALLVLGFIFTVLVSMISVILPSLKTKVTQYIFKSQIKSPKATQLIQQHDNDQIQSDEQMTPPTGPQTLFSFLYIFIYSLMHICTMMLVMTYNGYVILMVILGLTAGYTLSGVDSDKEKNIPVNCCA